jgi:hypothetical protein
MLEGIIFIIVGIILIRAGRKTRKAINKLK